MARKSKKKTKKIIGTLLSLLLACAAVLLLYMDGRLDFIGLPAMQGSVESYEGDNTVIGEFDAEVHFIDVGQGDSILIRSGGKAALIDAGERDQGKTVSDYLKSYQIKRIDYLFMTHPHTDHMGGMTAVLNEFAVGEIFLPEIPDNIMPTTQTFTDFLEAVQEKRMKISSAKAGDTYEMGKGILTVVSQEDFDDLNNISIVSRFDYDGGRSFLFTGDAEEKAEEQILKNGDANVKADVLKVAHHGSQTSTSDGFFQAVAPGYCVISVGEGNSYGHPTKSVLKRLEAGNARIYRTDFQGSTVFGIKDQKFYIRTGR